LVHHTCEDETRLLSAYKETIAVFDILKNRARNEETWFARNELESIRIMLNEARSRYWLHAKRHGCRM